MLDNRTIDGLIEAVRLAARTEILPRFRNLAPEDISHKSHVDDLVTVADRKAEALISQAARDLLPQALIVGEEAVAENAGLLPQMSGAEVSVIIDPIDGTSNFAAGISVFGVILAVQINGKTVFGLLYDPLGDDWICGRLNQGAYFHSARGETIRLQKAVSKPLELCTGFVPLYLFSKAEQAQLAQALPSFKRITTLRCSCHEYRQMALGNVDFTLNGMAKPWDHAAGALVLHETGGVVQTAAGEAYVPQAPKTPLWAFAWCDRHAQLDIQKALLPNRAKR